MFPIFSTLVRKLLILPVGTATVERSFSTMNRILSISQRCRLLPNHACQLMQPFIEGPKVPDVRDGSDNEQQAWNVLLDISIRKMAGTAETRFNLTLNKRTERGL